MADAFTETSIAIIVGIMQLNQNNVLKIIAKFIIFVVALAFINMK